MGIFMSVDSQTLLKKTSFSRGSPWIVWDVLCVTGRLGEYCTGPGNCLETAHTRLYSQSGLEMNTRTCLFDFILVMLMLHCKKN